MSDKNKKVNGNGELEFSLQTATRPVVLISPDGKTREHYELREMTVKDREIYSNDSRKRFIFDAKGEVIGINTFTGMQAELLTRCMVKIENGKPRLVTEAEVAGWPSKATTQIFAAAQEINHLKKTEEEAEAKKD
jgi:hypothetical protein